MISQYKLWYLLLSTVEGSNGPGPLIVLSHKVDEKHNEKEISRFLTFFVTQLKGMNCVTSSQQHFFYSQNNVNHYLDKSDFKEKNIFLRFFCRKNVALFRFFSHLSLSRWRTTIHKNFQFYENVEFRTCIASISKVKNYKLVWGEW